MDGLLAALSPPSDDIGRFVLFASQQDSRTEGIFPPHAIRDHVIKPKRFTLPVEDGALCRPASTGPLPVADNPPEIDSIKTIDHENQELSCKRHAHSAGCGKEVSSEMVASVGEPVGKPYFQAWRTGFATSLPGDFRCLCAAARHDGTDKGCRGGEMPGLTALTLGMNFFNVVGTALKAFYDHRTGSPRYVFGPDPPQSSRDAPSFLSCGEKPVRC